MLFSENLNTKKPTFVKWAIYEKMSSCLVVLVPVVFTSKNFWSLNLCTQTYSHKSMTINSTPCYLASTSKLGKMICFSGPKFLIPHRSKPSTNTSKAFVDKTQSDTTRAWRGLP